MFINDGTDRADCRGAILAVREGKFRGILTAVFESLLTLCFQLIARIVLTVQLNHG